MATTTLNIHIDVLSKINQHAIRLNKSKKEIIILLLMRIMKNHHLFVKTFSTVKYQRSDIKAKWHCFHIRFKKDENEFFVDLRKLCKYSVSCLVAISVERYLDELIMDIDKKLVDNYIYYKNYVLHFEVIDGIISWSFYWGYPEEHLKTLRL